MSSGSPVCFLDGSERQDFERDALVEVYPKGFHYRPPQAPHELTKAITTDEELFQTIHMGPAVVDRTKWKLVIDGLCSRPYAIDWNGLLQLPSMNVTSFHECYGSPVKPPTQNLWRIGCVTWTGVPLKYLLEISEPSLNAQFVWSDGLDGGEFFEAKTDRYQKDLPIHKALHDDTLIAYKLNGDLLSKERGGPVRLVVPGWYGTNSTKWLCRLSLQAERSMGPFTTIYYNETDPTDPSGRRKRPCWGVEPNSYLLTVPGATLGSPMNIRGRAWAEKEIVSVIVDINTMTGASVAKAECTVSNRLENEWVDFHCELKVTPGKYIVMSRATDSDGSMQPLKDRRNHAQRVEIEVLDLSENSNL